MARSCLAGGDSGRPAPAGRAPCASAPLLAPQLVLECWCTPPSTPPSCSATALPKGPGNAASDAPDSGAGGRKPATLPTALHTARSFPATASGPPAPAWPPAAPGRPCSTSRMLDALLARKWLPVNLFEALPPVGCSASPACCCCSVVLRACTAAFIVSRIWSSCCACRGTQARQHGQKTTQERCHLLRHCLKQLASRSRERVSGWPLAAAADSKLPGMETSSPSFA